MIEREREREREREGGREGGSRTNISLNALIGFVASVRAPASTAVANVHPIHHKNYPIRLLICNNIIMKPQKSWVGIDALRNRITPQCLHLVDNFT